MKRVTLAALVLCAACSGGREPGEPDPGGIMCTMEARSAFVVTVLDAVTGRNLAPTATVRVTDGSYHENLVATDGTYSGAYERDGTFTVVVSHPGYEQWQRAGVVVERDECHVIAEAVEARLNPSEAP